MPFYMTIRRDACYYGRIDFIDWSKNLDYADKDLSYRKDLCCNIVFLGKCIMNGLLCKIACLRFAQLLQKYVYLYSIYIINCFNPKNH